MRIGSLFSGYGGLETGIQTVLGGTVAWHSETDPAASRILAHHWPDVPNLGDVTTVDWSLVEPVDVITGGSPCQDVSHAGKRAGMRAGTRSGLWAAMTDAIDYLRPALVVWENVRGVLSAGADSDLEPCPWCMGDESVPDLRALGRVLGDLADLGYDTSWHGLRAADVGAPHGRFRVFVVAANPDVPAGGERWQSAPGQAKGWWAWADAGRRGGASATDAGGTRWPRASGREIQRGRESDERGDGRDASISSPGLGQPGTERPDGALVGRPLLPTPQSHDAKQGYGETSTQRSRPRRYPNPALADMPHLRWGTYAAAIACWEHILNRPAPAPTEPGRTGQPRLSPAFVEWLMGLPPGHVTDVPGVSRNDQLKCLGNGVVPQQAAAAVAICMAMLDGSALLDEVPA